MESKMVLIVDDDGALANVIALRLQKMGFTTMRSPDATHALLGAHKLRPHLIILDVNMPGGNGLAVCEMLASNPEHAMIPVIIYTGCSDDQTKRRARDLSARYVLKNPGSWAQVEANVKELIGDSALPPADEKSDCSGQSNQRDDLVEPDWDLARSITSGRPPPGTALADMDGAIQQTPESGTTTSVDVSPSPASEQERQTILSIDDGRGELMSMFLTAYSCYVDKLTLRARSGSAQDVLRPRRTLRCSTPSTCTRVHHHFPRIRGHGIQKRLKNPVQGRREYGERK
jgi:CheY-like chemotaxis protein